MLPQLPNVNKCHCHAATVTKCEWKVPRCQYHYVCNSYEIWMTSAMLPVSCCHSYQMWVTSAMLSQLSNLNDKCHGASAIMLPQLYSLNDKCHGVSLITLPQLSNLTDQVPWNLAHNQHLSSPNHLLSTLPTKKLSITIKFPTNVDILLRCDIQGLHFRVKVSK